jgi:hypothetical protein
MVTLLGPAVPEAIDAAAEARALFTALGAMPFLRFLDAAVEQGQASASPVGTRARHGEGP